MPNNAVALVTNATNKFNTTKTYFVSGYDSLQEGGNHLAKFSSWNELKQTTYTQIFKEITTVVGLGCKSLFCFTAGTLMAIDSLNNLYNSTCSTFTSGQTASLPGTLLEDVVKGVAAVNADNQVIADIMNCYNATKIAGQVLYGLTDLSDAINHITKVEVTGDVPLSS